MSSSLSKELRGKYNVRTVLQTCPNLRGHVDHIFYIRSDTINTRSQG